MAAENGRTIVGKKAIAAYINCSVRWLERLEAEGLRLYRLTENGTLRMDITDFEQWKAQRKRPV